MKDLLLQILTGLLRYALTGVLGWLIAKGIIRADQTPRLIEGIAYGVLVMGWFVWQTIKSHQTKLAALALDAGKTLDDAKAVVAAKLAPSLSTPADTAPVLKSPAPSTPIAPAPPAGGQ